MQVNARLMRSTSDYFYITFTCSSSVYNLLAHASVSRLHEDVQKDTLGILPPMGKLTHNLALQSVCC